MLKNDLMVNQKVEINREDDLTIYKSSIQIVDEDSFAISVPYHKGEPLILRSGDIITVKVFTKKERYIFQTRVLGRKQDQIPLYILDYPERTERLQARDFVRVKVSLDVYYQVVTEETKNQDIHIETTHKAITVDLSGGGALLAVDEKIDEGQLLFLRFTVKLKNKEKKLIETFGKVVRYDPPEGTRTKTLIGVRFVNFDERDRDDLIMFLFERMRNQRKIKDD